ncbi:DUF6907 domain-containing protein [Streptomyces sp. DT117]|uniref:DUF6907 domain-containing protein n=1 Tax=Streptomyces sp. DT117 TaxID=3393422 RepID=UPI003CF14114
MRTTTSIPATFKPSGGIVAQPTTLAVELPPVAPTATDDLYAAWQNMTAKDTANTPVAQLLTLLGIRLIEVDPDGLEDDTIGSFIGKVGEGIVVVPRTMPQADREPIVRRFLDQIGTEYKVLKERDPSGRMFREARLKIECFEWCTEDHTEPQFADDIIHAGKPAELEVTGESGERVPLLHSRLGVDPFSPDTVQRNPHVVLDDEQSMYFLPPMQALEFADEMTAFADEVRAQARRATRSSEVPKPAAPVAELGHYPWCDTAACNTHRYDESDGGGTFVEHIGATYDMPIPEPMSVMHDQLLSFNLAADESAVDASALLSFNSGGEGTTLDVAETDQAIANLEAALTALRAMRAQMVQGKQA